MFVTLDNTRKSGPKTFVIVKTANFWNVGFFGLLTSQRKEHIICTKISKIHCGLLKIRPRLFLRSIKREKEGQNLFFSGKVAFFFSKLWVFNNQLDTRKSPYNFQSSCPKSLWTFISCSLIFVTIDDTKENGPKTYVIVKTALFWEVCFYRPIRSPGHVLVICTKFQNTLWTFFHSSLTFLMFNKTKKNSPNFFLQRKGCFFFKSLLPTTS